MVERTYFVGLLGKEHFETMSTDGFDSGRVFQFKEYGHDDDPYYNAYTPKN